MCYESTIGLDVDSDSSFDWLEVCKIVFIMTEGRKKRKKEIKAKEALAI
jgi:hypothetical protein